MRQVQPGGARRDLALVFGAALLYFVLACSLEVAESLTSWASGYERWQVDELPLTLLLLAAGLGWFGRRRLAENRRLARELIVLQEKERRSIARELHDELGQCCHAIRIDAACIERQTRERLPGVHASAAAIGESAERIQQVVRSMLQRLRPGALDHLGLAACIEELARSWEQRQQIRCAFLRDGRIDGLGEQVNISTYRIVQECLTNIVRHSGARQASIRILRTPAPAAGDALRICIEDDGCGMNGRPRAGMGIRGMAERAQALGGSLRLGRGAQGGLRVEVLLPLNA